MSTPLSDVRARGQLSAAQLRAVGEAIDRAQPALQTEGDTLAGLVGYGGTGMASDPADIFAAKVTSVTVTLGLTKYGFTEYDLQSDGTFAEAPSPRTFAGTYNFAFAPSGQVFAVNDYVYLRRSSANPDLFEILHAADLRLVVKGKLDGTLTQGSSATLSVWAWNGSAEADTGENLTVYDWPLRSGEPQVAASSEVTAVKLNGRWYLSGYSPRHTAKGKLDGALAYGGSATMSVWQWNGSAEADTTENLTVYDWLLSSGDPDVPSGTQVTAMFDGVRWYVNGSQC